MDKYIFTIFILTLFASLFFPIEADIAIKGKVKKRNTVIRVDNNLLSTCYYNRTIFKNTDALTRLIFTSKYIFTGKISTVQSKNIGFKKLKRPVYKVFIRRVLKGDIVGFSNLINYRTQSNQTYTLAVGGKWQEECSNTKGWAAILFSKGLKTPLQLIIDPVPSTIERVGRIRAIIKGKK